MGCLNSNAQFNHWFGNIHLSGPCNRSCYFCIGQHMMALDPLNNLDKWPLDGLDEFVEKCLENKVSEINLTGSNTDPLLYHHIDKLKCFLEQKITNLVFGCRTNGELIKNNEDWLMFDKGSVSIPTFKVGLYKEIMGCGMPPDLKTILEISPFPVKVNVVLTPEVVNGLNEFEDLLSDLIVAGATKVNLREPYGQPHIGDPMVRFNLPFKKTKFGMPVYEFGGMKITYWDVHFVEVESVNLYANGVTSVTYPITKGHDEKTGKVMDQSKFIKSGRLVKQWNG